jgi:hypothetical protein
MNPERVAVPQSGTRNLLMRGGDVNAVCATGAPPLRIKTKETE